MAQIKTYARLKPSKKPYPGYTTSNNVLTIDIPDSKDMVNIGSLGLHNIRSNMSYDIVFNNIFLPEASQEQVFDGVAKDIINNFLKGYNGTIFAYGQTGTGKTYTVEGNSCGYQTRGLATRALSMIYQELENRADEHISVYLSYLEIYQEVAYDLLNPASRTMIPVIPFAKVTVVEGPRGSCILRGLSLHLAANEEIAQMLLLQGQANRHVAETPVNQRSSRSHGVFSVYLQARKHDSQVIISSKLHVVDLAGSERVSKTGVDGQQLTEAKSINLSLHHLETVIIALQTDRVGSAGGGGEKGEFNLAGSRSSSSFMSSPSSDTGIRGSRYVPYRNSLLTMILRDSLGGNCLTAMVATLSMDPENLGESISTCRFAQRVARIANYARRNEEVDDKVLIKKLKEKVAELENQVAELRSKGMSQPLTDEEVLEALSDQDRALCSRIMEEYLHGIINDPVSAGIYKISQFRECLSLLKHRFQDSPKLAKKNSPIIGPTSFEEGKGLVYNRRPQDGGDHAHKTLKNNKEEPLPVKYRPNEELIITESSQSTLIGGPVPSLNCSPPQLKGTSPGLESKASNIGRNKSPNQRSLPSVIPEDRDRDQVDHFLMGLGKNDGYKSPFEKKREKEIKKLGKKLNSMEEQKVLKEEELQVMKQDLVLQSLQMEEDGMRLKLQVSDEQVADQHIYLLQLKHLQADPDLISRELLVEKNLRKRQLKFREKLDNIMERKMGVERELSQLHQETNQNQAKSKVSFEEKFGQYKHGKGALNTRQVFAILKNEEKQQKKDVGNMEREKAIMKAKHVELKEMATLEKLRELKQILKMSQKYGQEVEDQDKAVVQGHQNYRRPSSGRNSSSATDGVMINSNDSKEFFTDNAVSLNMNHRIEQQRHEEEKVHPKLELNQMMARNKPVGSDTAQQGPYIAMTDHSGRSSTEINGHHFSMDKSNGNTYTPNSSWAQYLSQDDNMPEARSARSQGKLQANSPLNSSRSENKFHLNSSLHSQNSQSNIVVTNYHTEQDAYNSLDLFSKSKTMRRENSSQNHQPSSARDMNTSNNNDERLKNDSTGAHEGEDEVEDLELIDCVSGEASKTPVHDSNVSNKSATRAETSDSTITGDGKDLKLCDMEKLSASDILDSLTPTSVNISNSHETHSSSRTQPVLPPSEYINFMMTKEGFDARRMGLSSRTFESALSHMLDGGEARAKANVPELPYSTDPYEKYVRTSDLFKASPHSKHIKKSSKHGASYSSGKNQFVKDSTQRDKKVKVDKNPWGPEMKKTSISDRLTGFLDSPSDFLPASDKGNQYESSTNLNAVESLPVEDLEDAFDQPPQVQVDDSLDEDDSFFGQVTPRTKITALKQDEGEKTYMSRVVAEKQRIAKIKKARHAAELIQRNWRKYKTSH